MTMISENWGYLLEPGLREAFFTGFMKDQNPVYAQLFNIFTSENANEDDLAVAGLGMWDQRDDDAGLALDQMEQIAKITYTHETYRKNMKVTKSLWEDKKYNILEKYAEQMGIGANRRVETVCANVFNNAFSGGQAMPDGGQLCADSRTLKRSSSTNDNKGTLALDTTNLGTAITALKDQLDDTGGKLNLMPSILLVPTGLEWTARKLLESGGLPGVANNDINPFKNYMQLVVWPYLTDSTAWFLIDKAMAQLNFFWRVKPEYSEAAGAGTTAVKYFEGRMRFSVGASDYRGVWGSTGGD